jgi:HUS1 checkpoint protein
VITHHIPARVLSVQFVSTLKEPTLPPEDVHILLPSPSETLRAVSERYKSLSEKLFVMANMAGELKLRVEAEEVKVETRWSNLVNPPLGTHKLQSVLHCLLGRSGSREYR